MLPGGYIRKSPLVAYLAVIATLVFIILIVESHILVPHGNYIQLQFHSAIQTAGALTALLLSCLILYQSPRHSGLLQAVYFLSSAFACMGVFDLFHSLVTPGESFIWFHTIATVSGGVFFAMVWLPERSIQSKKLEKLPPLVFITSVLFAVVSIAKPSLIPVMADNEHFSTTATSLNQLGSALFLLASLKFLLRCVKKYSTENFVFACLCLLFGASGLLFDFSKMWCVTWWQWHVVRLAAYLIALYYIVMLYEDAAKVVLAEKEHAQRYLDVAAVIIVALDARGNISVINRTGCELLGYEEKELSGKNWFDMCLPEKNRHTVKKVFAELVSGNADFVKYYENLVQTRTGEERLIAWHNNFVKSNEGNIIGVIASGVDITEHKRVEEERRLQSEIMNNMTEGVDLVRMDGTIVYTNPKFEEMFGYGPGEMIGKHFSIVNYPTEIRPEETAKNILEAIDKEGVWKGEIQNIKKDGTSFWSYASVSAFEHSNHGKIIVSVYNDITERKQVEKKLKESEAKYRTLFEESGDAVFISTVGGRLLDVNSAMLNLFSYSLEEILEINVQQLYWNPEDRLRYQEVIERSGAVMDYEIRYRQKDDTPLDCLVTASLRKDSSGNILGYQGIIRDITERRKAEEEKAKLESQLLRTQKMEAIGTMAGGIAHDFNNILAIITSATELAMDEVPEGSQARYYNEEVLKAAFRARELVKQILAFGRQSRQEFMPVRPHLIIKEYLKLVRSTIPATVEIRQNIESRYGFISADPSQIHQVIMNLCVNAVHAMDEKGVLEVSMKEVNLSSEDLRHKPRLIPGPYTRLSVRDSGCGMDGETLARIFDPFFTTKEVGKGTGLGLSVVHGIVESHGGMITVESEPGKGTAFHVFFPVIKGESPEKMADGSDALPIGTERILFVDDEVPLSRLTCTMLEDQGYLVTARTNGKDALATFMTSPDDFDLVITDQSMAKMSGLELAQAILTIRPDMPVILCTGFSTKVSERKIRELGIRELCCKPLTRKMLAETIRKVLDEKT